MGMKSTVFDLVLKYMNSIRMHRDVSVLKHIYHTSYLLCRHTLKISSQPQIYLMSLAECRGLRVLPLGWGLIPVAWECQWWTRSCWPVRTDFPLDSSQHHRDVDCAIHMVRIVPQWTLWWRLEHRLPTHTARCRLPVDSWSWTDALVDWLEPADCLSKLEIGPLLNPIQIWIPDFLSNQWEENTCDKARSSTSCQTVYKHLFWAVWTVKGKSLRIYWFLGHDAMFCHLQTVVWHQMAG